MNEASPTRGQRIARAACAFERERTGRTPGAVTVALTGETLVITLRGALSPAERAVAQAAQGAPLIQQFYRALFASAGGALRQEIERITGAEVREAAVEVQGITATLILVFLLSGNDTTETWCESPAEIPGDK